MHYIAHYKIDAHPSHASIVRGLGCLFICYIPLTKHYIVYYTMSVYMLYTIYYALHCVLYNRCVPISCVHCPWFKSVIGSVRMHKISFRIPRNK